MMLERVAIADCILTQGNQNEPWNPEYVACSWPKAFGVGADKMLAGIDRNKPALLGKDLLTVLRQHHVVILQHWPDPAWIKELRSEGSIKKVLLWCDWRAVPNPGYWSSRQLDVGNFLLSNPLPGSKPNRFGQMTVDPYEAALPDDPWKKPHCTLTDFTNPGFAPAYAQMIGTALAPYRNAQVINGILYDDCLDWPYTPASTTNMPTTSYEVFVKCLQEILAFSRKLLFGSVWGNCGAPVLDYAALDVQWDELGLGNATPSWMAERVRYAIRMAEFERRPRGYCFNVLPGQGSWLKFDSWWTQIATQLVDLEDRLSLVTYRSGSDGTCLLPSVCEEP